MTADLLTLIGGMAVVFVVVGILIAMLNDKRKV